MQELNNLRATEERDLIGTGLGYYVADSYHPHQVARIRKGRRKVSLTSLLPDDVTFRSRLRRILAKDSTAGMTRNHATATRVGNCVMDS